MIKKLKKRMMRPNGLKNLPTPEDVFIEFVLKYKNLTIGKLTLDNGEWKFEYTEAFKNQNNITPLSNFPSLNKVYTSSELWPFFATRIPSLTQLQQKHENVERNEAALLKRFGARTITNPFVLLPA